jgi:hypothetical protein
MVNPLSVVSGEVVDITTGTGALAQTSDVILERLQLRHPEKGDIILPLVQVPADLVDRLQPGSNVKLVLFGAPSVKSQVLGVMVGDTTIIKVPPHFSKIRRTLWTMGLTMDAAALACPILWQGWGAIPGLILFFLALGPERMAHAAPSFGRVQALLAASSPSN